MKGIKGMKGMKGQFAPYSRHFLLCPKVLPMPAALTALTDPSPQAPGQLAPLQRKAVSEVKREGWRGIMRSVSQAGGLLMTNHEQPEAVILSLAQYKLLAEQASRAQQHSQNELQRLTRAFDAELAVLQAPGAGDRLRDAFGAPLPSPLKPPRKPAQGRSRKG